MRLRCPSLSTLAVLLAACGAGRAQVVIPGLFNTGVSASGGLLPEGSLDPHYTLTMSPAGSGFGSGAYVALTGASPITGGGWQANGPLSEWLVPQPGGFAVDHPGGNYTYRTTFDLTGFNPNQATITMRLTADNAVTVLLNGVATGVSSTAGPPFVLSAPQKIATGFVSGVNTLDFLVFNGAAGFPPGPTGLRVEMTSSVPEPSSLALLGAAGSAGLLAARRRRVARVSGAKVGAPKSN